MTNEVTPDQGPERFRNPESNREVASSSTSGTFRVRRRAARAWGADAALPSSVFVGGAVAVTSGAMKFNATVVFEFAAHDVAEAGQRVDALLELAREAVLEARSIELSTAPGVAVSLPPVAPAR